jgi:hypothetical protein
MVLVQKLTSFAWNVYDGRQKIEVEGTLMSLTSDTATMAEGKGNTSSPITS